MATSSRLEIAPLRPERFDDLAGLFATTAMTRRCHCTWFLVRGRERDHVWTTGMSRGRFEDHARESGLPLGVLGYEDGQAVAWCAAAPRAAYPTVRRSPLMTRRDPGEDASVWFVSCFYVHRSVRHRGVTRRLLDGVVELARASGANAVEGLPRAAGDRADTVSAYVGAESVFAAGGFAVVDRPSPRRVLMRLELGP